MRQDTVTILLPTGIDFKAISYLISIASVLFLGAVAWAKENPPGWYYPVLIAGMATSIMGASAISRTSGRNAKARVEAEGS